MADLVQLVYVSTARLGLTEDDVAAITAKSNVSNKDNGISGLLLYNGVNFMQCIEGAPDAIRQLMDNIASDPRHVGVIVVNRQAIARRSFEAWSMKFVPALRSKNRAATVDHDNKVAGNLPGGIEPSVRKLLESFDSLA